ncbi:MAG: glycosyltransferase [Actinomycetota bacterium]
MTGTIGATARGFVHAASATDPHPGPSLDIIIPAHNEANRIGPTLDAFRRGFPGAGVRFIVALDDCEDATADIVRRHAEHDARVELHDFPKLGKGGVIRRAFRVCGAEFVAYVDADGSTSPEQLARLVDATRRADGAIASRRLPASSVLGSRALARNAASFVFAWMVRRLFGLPYRDTQCGAKVMRRETLGRLLPHVTTTDLLFDLDLLLRADDLDYRIVEVPSVWVARTGSKVRLLRDFKQVTRSLLRLWIDWRRRRAASGDAVLGSLPPKSRAADVVLVSPYPPPGKAHVATTGVAAYTVDLARSLTDLGLRVAVVAPDEPNAPSTHADGGVTVVRSGPRGALALPRSLRMAGRMNPRVIHLQHEMFLYGGVMSLATLPLAVAQMRRRGPGAFITMHQVLEPGQVDSELMRLHRLTGPVTAARLAVAGYQRLLAATGTTIVHEPQLARHVPKAVVIPHGVGMAGAVDRDHARRRLGLEGERRLVVLCFGYVAPYKGLESALVAAAQVPEVRLVVAGGDHPRHGAAYSRELRDDWGHVARFTGWVPDDDIAAWHAAADLALFCYPAPHSSSGAVAVALAHGTPVLAGDALARAMTLPDGMAVSLEDGELAERLRRLANDPRLLADLGRASSRVVSGRTWSEVAERHLWLYRSAAADLSDIRSRSAGTPEHQGQLEVA